MPPDPSGRHMPGFERSDDKGAFVMTGWEIFIFVSLVIGALMLVVGIAWFRWWKRNPGQFKAGWRDTPLRSSPMRGLH